MKPCPLRYGVSVFRTSLYSSKYTPGDDEESRGQNGSEDGGDEPGDDDRGETLAEGELREGCRKENIKVSSR